MFPQGEDLWEKTQRILGGGSVVWRGGRDLAGCAMYADLERVKLWLNRGSNFLRFVRNLCHFGALKTHGEERRGRFKAAFSRWGWRIRVCEPLFCRKQETPTVSCSQRLALCRALHPSRQAALHTTGTCSRYSPGSYLPSRKVSAWNLPASHQSKKPEFPRPPIVPGTLVHVSPSHLSNRPYFGPWIVLSEHSVINKPLWPLTSLNIFTFVPVLLIPVAFSLGYCSITVCIVQALEMQYPSDSSLLLPNHLTYF